jgi:hypothetical protein
VVSRGKQTGQSTPVAPNRATLTLCLTLRVADMHKTKPGRKILIDLARRHQRPGSGSARAFLLERTARMKFPDLTPVLGSIPWAAVGAAATRLYMPERTTKDLDVLIKPADASEARRKLAAAGFTHKGERAIGGSSWTTPDGFSVDVLELEEPWTGQALAEAQANRDPQGLPVLPLPYLSLTKFQSGRVQDTADLARMLGQANEEALAAVRAVFRQWLPAEMEDLESLIELGQLEMSK